MFASIRIISRRCGKDDFEASAHIDLPNLRRAVAAAGDVTALVTVNFKGTVFLLVITEISQKNKVTRGYLIDYKNKFGLKFKPVIAVRHCVRN
jgi:hypothetical protein